MVYCSKGYGLWENYKRLYQKEYKITVFKTYDLFWLNEWPNNDPAEKIGVLIQFFEMSHVFHMSDREDQIDFLH